MQPAWSESWGVGCKKVLQNQLCKLDSSVQGGGPTFDIQLFEAPFRTTALKDMCVLSQTFRSGIQLILSWESSNGLNVRLFLPHRGQIPQGGDLWLANFAEYWERKREREKMERSLLGFRSWPSRRSYDMSDVLTPSELRSEHIHTLHSAHSRIFMPQNVITQKLNW